MAKGKQRVLSASVTDDFQSLPIPDQIRRVSEETQFTVERVVNLASLARGEPHTPNQLKLYLASAFGENEHKRSSRLWDLAEYFAFGYLELCRVRGEFLEPPKAWGSAWDPWATPSYHIAAWIWCSHTLGDLHVHLQPQPRKMPIAELACEWSKRSKLVKSWGETITEEKLEPFPLLKLEAMEALRVYRSVPKTGLLAAPRRLENPTTLGEWLGIDVDSDARMLAADGDVADFQEKPIQWAILRELLAAGESGMLYRDLHTAVWPSEKAGRSTLDNRKREINNAIINLGIEVVATNGNWTIQRLT